MAVNPPPIQEKTTDPNNGRFPQVWIRWFGSVQELLNDISLGGVISVNGQTGVAVLDLDDLNDVNASSPNTNDVIKWNGSVWVTDSVSDTSTKSRNTSNTTIDSSAYHWLGNTDSAGFTYTLPAGVDGTQYRIVNTGTSGNTLTISPNGSDNLLGANSSFDLSDGEALIIIYDSNDGWW